MRKKRILIIDDDTYLLKLLHKRLEYSGFQCFEAPSIERGLLLLESLRPDLVIVDIMFPSEGLDGSSFIHLVKERMKLYSEKPPILVLSSIHDKEVINYMLESGANAYLCKPFKPEELLATINEYLRRA